MGSNAADTVSASWVSVLHDYQCFVWPLSSVQVKLGRSKLIRVLRSTACMLWSLLLDLLSRPDWGCCYAGKYVTEDISPAYLQSLEESVRMQDRKRSGEKVALVV